MTALAATAGTTVTLGIAVALGVAMGGPGAASWSDGWRWTLYMVASAAVAAALGLVFAIPRARAEVVLEQSERYRSNSNLEDISDWLTKLLVGATLVQLGSIPGALQAAGEFLGADMAVPNATAYSASALVFGAGLGFLTAYVWTRLRMRALLESSDRHAADESKTRRIAGLLEDAAPGKATGSRSDLTRVVDEAVDVAQRRRDGAGSAAVLWVDDHPENNASLVSALRELDIRVDVALSTEDAKARLHEPGAYEVVITDLGRTEDGVEQPMAGKSLIEWVRSTDNRTPVLVYAGSRGLEHSGELFGAGATLVTDRPSELFKRTVSAALG